MNDFLGKNVGQAGTYPYLTPLYHRHTSDQRERANLFRAEARTSDGPCRPYMTVK